MKDLIFARNIAHLPTDAIEIRKRVTYSMPSKLDHRSLGKILDQIDTFIFDADGVLWLGNEALPGSADFVRFILQQGKRVIVLTNNATKSRLCYASKLHSIGFPLEITAEQIVNPAAIVAEELHRAGFSNSKQLVYLIGAKGVREEMDKRNIKYFGHGCEESSSHLDGSAFQFEIDLPVEPERVGAVVVGYERHFDYQKLMKAANYLQHQKTRFLATNEDEVCPGPNPEVLIPDAGPIVAAIQCASGRKPLTVGKPYSPAFDYICRRWSIDETRTMMIGDRTNTDVLFGRKHGLKTCLVLSGCHQLKDVQENLSKGKLNMVPDFYANSLGSLLKD
ncbi:unnamed protein product, partial [Mesorhabditis belari]|uniref:Phosphoglycolate phosphatase n=1 Tax=Mesorhabditis belari TaxID=2138241 RepID=A0AAF3F2D1_9BILA